MTHQNRDQQLTNYKVVHADVALARYFLRLEIFVCELMNGQVLDETDSLGNFDLLVFR